MAKREALPTAAKPLSAEDLAILRLEAPTVAGHTLKVAILDLAPAKPRPDIEALRARVDRRIERAGLGTRPGDPPPPAHRVVCCHPADLLDSAPLSAGGWPHWSFTCRGNHCS